MKKPSKLFAFSLPDAPGAPSEEEKGSHALFEAWMKRSDRAQTRLQRVLGRLFRDVRWCNAGAFVSNAPGNAYRLLTVYLCSDMKNPVSTALVTCKFCTNGQATIEEGGRIAETSSWEEGLKTFVLYVERQFRRDTAKATKAIHRLMDGLANPSSK